MKILIIGGAGYLGPVVARQIKSNFPNYNITSIDLNLFKNSAFENFLNTYDKSFIKDKRDLVENDIKGFDCIIDLAAISNDPMGEDFVHATMDINYESTIKLVYLAKKCKIKKYIYASSCSIYGAAGDQPKSEDDTKDPLTAYAKSKWLTEVELAKIANKNFNIIALRFATACGWSPMFRGDLVLNDFVLTALSEKKITVLSDGTPWRPLINTKDIGLAVTWSVINEFNKNFDYFNIGSDDWTLTIKELAFKVGSLLNVPVEILGNQGGDRRSYRVDFKKFSNQADIKWLPKENLETSVLTIKSELEKHADRIVNFRSSNLIRLNVLRRLINEGKLNNNIRKNL